MGTNRNTLRLYLRQVKKHWPSFLVAIIAIPSATLLLDTFLPYNLSLAIGELTKGEGANISGFLITAAIVGTVGLIANFVGFQMLIRHESSVRSDLYNATFKSLLGKDFAFFLNEKIGSLTSRFIDFGRSHVALQDLLIMRTLGFVLSMVTSLVIVATHTPILAAILAGLIILIIVQIRISIKIRKPYRILRKKLIAEIHGKVADGLTNNLIVKTFAGEKAEQQILQKDLSDYNDAYIKDYGIMTTDGAIRNTIMTITQIVAVGLCAYYVTQGSLDIAIAIFTLTYVQRASTQIFAMGQIIQGFEQAFLDAAPMSDMLMKAPTVVDKPNAITLTKISPTIELENASYHYDDRIDTNVIDNISLTIPAGQKVGLVGHSGAGKTTITHLLLRFSDVTGGAIKIDGHDLRDIAQESLRQHIAYVPQEPMLFHRTLRENIAYGTPGASTKAIEAAATKANAMEFIADLPLGLDTIVGERGVKLSGGQRQRIAIARAVLKDAPILILDEATSALDSESEKLIQDALQKLMKGRTSIVIAHRLSTISKLDRVIVLDKGDIAEDGSHEALLNEKGIYAKLWAHQSGGFIEE